MDSTGEFLEVVLDFGIEVEETPKKGLRALLEKDLHTDVTFIVEGSPVPAHRVIVASQSEYFDHLLYGRMKESKASTITLEDTHLEAFRLLLMYMYTGSVRTLDMQSAMELLGLADRYGFEYLKKMLQERFCTILDDSNALLLLCCADMFNATKLHQDCLNFIDSNTEAILAHNTILSVPQGNFAALISRDTFVAEEMTIFRAVQRWMEYNGKSKEDVPALLECIRLTEIPKHSLLDDVFPSGLYSMTSIFVAIETQQAKKLSDMAPRGRHRGKNLFADRLTVLAAHAKFSFQELTQTFSSFGRGSRDCGTIAKLAFTLLCKLAYGEVGVITLEFSDAYLINELKFNGYPDPSDETIQEPFCYKIELSKDGSHWATAVDYSHLKCYSLQQLYFPNVTARYLRYVQTRGHAAFNIHLISCSLADTVQFDFRDNGVMAPKVPITPVHTHFVSSNDSKVLRCFLTFNQPYSISLLSFDVRGLQGAKSIVVSVSTVNKTRAYKDIATFKDHDLRVPLQMKFEERPVSIVSITFHDVVCLGDLDAAKADLVVENLICQAVT